MSTREWKWLERFSLRWLDWKCWNVGSLDGKTLLKEKYDQSTKQAETNTIAFYGIEKQNLTSWGGYLSKEKNIKIIQFSKSWFNFHKTCLIADGNGWNVLITLVRREMLKCWKCWRKDIVKRKIWSINKTSENKHHYIS